MTISADLAHPTAGDPVDLAPFAWVRWWAGTERHDLQVNHLTPEADGCYRAVYQSDTGECHLGLEWPEPQNVRRVVVRFTAGQVVPADLRVEYWRKYWPTPAAERLPGASRGWIGTDDAWNGGWTTVRAARTTDHDTCAFDFDPVDLAEIHDVARHSTFTARQLEESGDYLVPFRRTLKIRLVSRGQDAPVVREVHAYSEGSWREMTADIQFHQEGDWGGQAAVSHGYLLGVEPAGQGMGVTEGAAAWRLPGPTGAIRLRLLCAQGEPMSGSTIVTVRTGERSFSFMPLDLAEGPIYIKDYGVFITPDAQRHSYEQFLTQVAAAPRPIYERVSEEPEQSLSRAMAEIPPLDVVKQDSLGQGLGRYVVLGVEAGRQEIGLRYNGELFMSKPFLKPAGRDMARLIWPGTDIRFRVGSGDPPDFRERSDGTRQSRIDGYLPIFVSEWLDREIEWRETAFAALLDGPMTSQDARRGDEDIVAMVRFTMRNTTPGRKRACLWLAVTPQEEWQLRDGCVLALGRMVPDVPVARQWRVDPYRKPVLRFAAREGKGLLSAVPFADGDASRAIPAAMLYQVDLAQGERDTFDVALPFVSLDDAEEWARVRALDWESKYSDVAGYWRNHVAAGGHFDLPEPLLCDFQKAVRSHVAITVDKDPASGLTVVPPATFSYGACANEACWQIGMLDEAGYHDRAENYLETFLQTQGAAKLDGRFISAEGALQGLDLDEGKPVWSEHVFGYNLDHGCIMECLARHYRLTQDKAWLTRMAPNLIAACDLIIREREATKVSDPDGRPVAEWGLLPAGHLEDNAEWQHWFSVNAHAHGGMKAIAEILTEIGHPDAPRLAREMSAYREDIRRAARRAMVEAPVVRLLDGTYIPRLPARIGLRGREWGWFREAAYGALHLLDGDVFDPWEEEMTWVLKDLEDNLFVSREWGRPVDLERFWFSHGGATIQCNLMDLGIAYLRRGQVEHALRALFNNFGSQLFPDVRVFTEHPVTELGSGIGPFYKSSDEAKALQWLRAFLLREEGETLHLASGAPRAWFAPGGSFAVRRMASFFGPLSYQLEADSDKVTVQVQIPDRRPPQELVLHLRRPGRQVICGVTVNGRAHTDFDPAEEVVRMTRPSGSLTIRATYAA